MHTRNDNNHFISPAFKAIVSILCLFGIRYFNKWHKINRQKKALQQYQAKMNELNGEANEKAEQLQELINNLKIANKEIEINNRVTEKMIEEKGKKIKELNLKLNNSHFLSNPENHYKKCSENKDKKTRNSVIQAEFSSYAVLFSKNKTQLQKHRNAQSQMELQIENADRIINTAKEMLAASEECILKTRENEILEERKCQSLS